MGVDVAEDPLAVRTVDFFLMTRGDAILFVISAFSILGERRRRLFSTGSRELFESVTSGVFDGVVGAVLIVSATKEKSTLGALHSSLRVGTWFSDVVVCSPSPGMLE